MKCPPRSLCGNQRGSAIRSFFTGTTLSLCLSAATHSFLLFSFFPYAGYMSVDLLNSGDNEAMTVNGVGWYAGCLGTVFTFGRFFGFVPWKKVRRRLGGKRALILSLFFTGLSSVWVGLATTYGEALAARFVQGFSNCISGCVKRALLNAKDNMMSQRMKTTRRDNGGGDKASTRPEEIGYNAQALVLSIMWWGTALGPFVGGYLSDPVLLDAVMPPGYSRHPNLLSNLFSAALCWLSMICVTVSVRDSSSKKRKFGEGERRSLMLPSSGGDPNRDDDNTDVREHGVESRQRLFLVFLKLWRVNKAARYHLAAYWFLSFVVVLCDEALPLYLITTSTGLGLSSGHVGLAMSAAGLIVACSHHAALERLFDVEHDSKDGIYRILGWCAFFGTVTTVFVPFTQYLNGFSGGGVVESSSLSSSILGLTPSAFVFLVILTAFVRIAISLYFSFIGMAFGRTLRVIHKDEAARIMTIVGLFFRSLAPLVAGAIVSHYMSPSYQTHYIEGDRGPIRPAWMVWTVIGIVFGGAATAMTTILTHYSGDGVLTSAQRAYVMARLKRMSSGVNVNVRDTWGVYEASKTLLWRWFHSIFHGPTNKKERKRTSSSSIETTTIEASLTKKGGAAPRRISWSDHIVAAGVIFEEATFFILGTNKRDKRCAPHVLTPPLMAALQKHLPPVHAESNFWLRYSLLRDGAALHSLEAKAGLAQCTVMAIETLKGQVFGCFMDKPWEPSNNQYRRAGESFLWRLTKRRLTDGDEEDALESQIEESGDDLIEVYPYTKKNDLCQLVGDREIGVGGGIVKDPSGQAVGDGFGIAIGEDLLSGSSGPCETYGNPMSLTGDESRFEVANIEVWSLTSFMFVSDAEKSEKAIQFRKENDLETPSSISPWSQFL